MALFALPECAFVNDGEMSFHFAPLVVAHPAWNLLMRAVELEGRMAAMVELGGPPAQIGVAPRASSSRLKLASVDVGMAGDAILAGSFERNAPHRIFNHRLVTGQAGHRGVAPEQREGRLAVVELFALLPRTDRVAGPAARRCVELFVRVLVAGSTLG